VFVNPNSGTGIAKRIFDEQVAPLLVEAELPYDLQLTQGPNYARNYVRQRPDLAIVYSDIIIVSGDGLLFEVKFVHKLYIATFPTAHMHN
jgi:sphingosine kinase